MDFGQKGKKCEMKKYVVKVVEKFTRYIEVWAESEDAALDTITNKMTGGEIDLPCDGGDYKYDNDIEVVDEIHSEV